MPVNYDRKYPTIVTPQGEVAMAFLDKPSTKFNPDGTFLLQVRFHHEDEDLTNFAKDLEEYGARRLGDLRQPGDTPIILPITKYLDDEGAWTGDMLVKMDANAVIRKRGSDGPGTQNRPQVVDARLQPIVPTPNVGAGTVAKVSCELWTTFGPRRPNGTSKEDRENVLRVKLRIRAVQILKLVEWKPQAPTARQLGLEEEAEFEPISSEVAGEFDPAEYS